MRIAMGAVALIGIVLAGCSGVGPEDGDGNGDPAADCSLATSGIPGHAVPGEAFSFDVQPECDEAWTSDHVAAHWASARSTEAALSAYPNACTIHAESEDEGHQPVNCSIPEAGTYYLRGHAIVDAGAGPQHVWGPERVIVVAPADDPTLGSVQVSIFDVPSTATAGEAFPLHVEVTWAVPPPGVPSDHLGAHFWMTPQDAPSTGLPGTNTCDHTTGNVPGSLDITCTAEEAGTIYLRGHARFEVGGELSDYWSGETPIVVA